jgi:NAD(P)H-flavin reductase
MAFNKEIIDMTMNPMVPQPFLVKEFVEETHDTFTLKLQSRNGQKNFFFQPGQFNMLYIFGVGEVPVSISGNPDAPQTLVHTIRAVGTVTKALRRIKAGETLGVRGPFGSSWPVNQIAGKDILIVTGGIGLAPLRPAVYHILGQRNKIGKFVLLYGARSPNDILYSEELNRWSGQFDLQVRVTVDKADHQWLGTVGVVTILIDKARVNPAKTIAMVCGPEIMMNFSIKELLNTGMKERDIFISMERNMKCAVGFCGHCQYGPNFICKDGAVFPYSHVKNFLKVKEI